MCGIVGGIANRDVVPVLTEGLRRLEYRGYDSAGIAVINDGIKRVRRVGRVAEMEAGIKAENLNGVIGIGHTRWATHGGVTEWNAHPHVSQNEIAVVHNGIIENHEAERERLKREGYAFESQTDTEVISHLIHFYRKTSPDLLVATQRAVSDLHGAYAIAVVSLGEPSTLVVARMGCPLLIGLGEGENFIASDVSAVLPVTRRVIYLEEGDVAALTLKSVRVFDRTGKQIERPVHLSEVDDGANELGPYQHFMQKEIHEQPRALSDTLEAVLSEGVQSAHFGEDAAQVFAAS
jgi:glutamine---fructose-6-phosphate transaminase (isomerizing)